MKWFRNAWEHFRGTLPAEYLPGLPDIRIVGMQDAYVEAHRGLLAYSGEKIMVRAADRTLCITGKGLTLCCVTMQEVHVRGLIRSVETVD